MTESTPAPAKRNPALIPLSHDHHNGLARARDIVLALDGVVPQDLHELAASSHRFAEAELLPHFEREERFLIPPFIAHVGDSDPDLQTFVSQHQQLRQLSTELLNSTAPLEQLLSNWSKALTAHIRFEERTLFKRVQAALTADEMATLGAALNTGGPACSL